MITSILNISKEISKETGLKTIKTEKSRVKGLPNTKGDFKYSKGEIFCKNTEVKNMILSVIDKSLIKFESEYSIFTTEYKIEIL